jgi:hypothetical protein
MMPFIFVFIVMLGGHCGIYKGSYSVSDVLHLSSLPAPLSYITPPPIPGTVSTAIIFAFAYMCTH